MRQNFEPLGLVDFRKEVGVRELRILGPQMLRHSQPDVIGGKRLAKALMRERRFVPELVDRVFRRDIQRSVDIDQGAVEIEKDCFEFARRQKILRASQRECVEMRRKLSSTRKKVIAKCLA